MTEYNKVIYDGQTLIDLTQDDVTQADVRQGVYFHDSAGVRSQGTLAESDYIVEKGISGGWNYRKWDSGRIEAEKDITSGSSWTSINNGMYYNNTTLTPPTGMTVESGCASLSSLSQYIVNAQVQVGSSIYLTLHRLASSSASFTCHVTLIGTYT